MLEVLALPAVPLTMTAGLLFGVPAGTAVVSVSSTAAATISFLIARYAGAPLACLLLILWEVLLDSSENMRQACMHALHGQREPQ